MNAQYRLWLQLIRFSQLSQPKSIYYFLIHFHEKVSTKYSHVKIGNRRNGKIQFSFEIYSIWQHCSSGSLKEDNSIFIPGMSALDENCCQCTSRIIRSQKKRAVLQNGIKKNTHIQQFINTFKSDLKALNYDSVVWIFNLKAVSDFFGGVIPLPFIIQYYIKIFLKNNYYNILYACLRHL